MTTPTTAGDDRVAHLKHPRTMRWMHWINFPLIAVMMYSGMRIYWADRRDPFAVGVADYDFTFWPDAVNDQLQLGSKLAAGIGWHFTFAWLFVLNGLAYVLYTGFSGEWRQIIPERRSLRDARQVVLHDAFIDRSTPLPPQARYNGAQRIIYTLVIGLGGLAVASGFAIYKPTQLSPLTRLFGGYEWARGIHFSVTIAFMAFFLVHILQVARAGWRNFMSMITGYELEAKAKPEPPENPDEPEGDSAAENSAAEEAIHG